MSILQIKDLIHQYIIYGEKEEENQTVNAVNGVDMSVEKGEFIAILGHNGSGKSSLAKHINGLLQPTSGSVYLKSMDTRDHEKLLKIRQSAGIVFQNPDNQIVGSVVEEDVAFGPENIGVPTKDIWSRVAGALEGVGMTAYRNAQSFIRRAETARGHCRDHGHGTRMYNFGRAHCDAGPQGTTGCSVSCRGAEQGKRDHDHSDHS